MRRLFHQVYLTIVVSLILVVMAAGAFWRFASEQPQARRAFEMAGEVAAAALPPADASFVVQRQALRRLGKRFGVDLALYTATGLPIASVGDPLPRPTGRTPSGWRISRFGPSWTLNLPDGRKLVVRTVFDRHGHSALGVIGVLGVIALMIAVGAYPVVRRLTGRLERLQSGVNSLGAGDLAARVKVEGRDEVAQLAASFNHAAARIEELVNAHKLLLANASHELRTPLSRICMSVELMKERADPARKAALERDVAELDHLIDEILLSSRLDSGAAPDSTEDVDLLALAAEEGAHFEQCEVDGEPVVVTGDPGLLRRMVRNLLQNAARHGVPPIAIRVQREGDGTGARALLAVADYGAGIPEADFERVFTPFQRLPSTGDAGGAGLGLALVRQIARRHGGEASIAPNEAYRSRFVVWLPLAGA